jgi:thiol-disulfide isomerase/thioredoxin
MEIDMATRYLSGDRSRRALSRRRVVGATALLLAAVCGAPIFLSSAASAAAAFDMARFEAAQRAGKTIVLGIHADWCPVCSIQKPIVAQLLEQSAFAGAVHFLIDYDRDKSLVRRFNVPRQSTIIVLKGTTETGRLIGETSTAKIDALLRSGL